MKNKIAIIVIITLLLTICGCSKEEMPKEDLLNINYDIKENETQLSQYETKNPVVAMYIENYGSIVLELYPEIAPNTVNNFISLVKSGFYDENTIHRLVPGFVLQGGDPTGTGTGDPGYKIKGEFSNNGFKNELKHSKGIVSMARASYSNDTAGSQFFIVLDDAEHLDGDYATFGKVIDGWENITRIVENEKVINTQTGKLKTNLTIKKSIIDLKGKNYKEPEKITE